MTITQSQPQGQKGILLFLKLVLCPSMYAHLEGSYKEIGFLSSLIRYA